MSSEIIVTEKKTSDENSLLPFVEQTLVLMHGVPPEAAAAAVKNMGKIVNFSTAPDGTTKITLPSNSFLSLLKNFWIK